MQESEQVAVVVLLCVCFVVIHRGGAGYVRFECDGGCGAGW